MSRATVSYVLNGAPGQKISEQTRALVLKAAEDLGYRPNLAAKSLAAGESNLMLFVIPSVPMGELALTVSSRLTSELAAQGLTLAVYFEADNPKKLVEVARDLHPLAVLSIGSLAPEIEAALHADGIPFTSAGQSDLNALADVNEAAGRTQVEHLVDRGHIRIAFADSSYDGLEMLRRPRLRGVRAGCEAANIMAPPVEVFASDGSNAGTLVARWHAAGVTAVAAYNDDVAFLVLLGLREAGLRCPADLAVIGVDAIPLGVAANPPLTSVMVDPSQAAHLMATMLLESVGRASAAVTPGYPAAVPLAIRSST